MKYAKEQIFTAVKNATILEKMSLAEQLLYLTAENINLKLKAETITKEQAISAINYAVSVTYKYARQDEEELRYYRENLKELIQTPEAVQGWRVTNEVIGKVVETLLKNESEEIKEDEKL